MTISGPHTEEHDLGATPLAGADGRLDALLSSGDRRLRLWAPASVALDHGAGLSVGVGAAACAEDLPRLALDRRAFVVATHVESGVTRVVRTPDPGGSSRLPPMPADEVRSRPAPRPLGAQVVRLEAWAHGAAWPAGVYALVAVAGDRASERVEIAIGSSVGDPTRASPEPESLRVWPPPDPAGNLPHYHPLEPSPAVPATPGIALVAERAPRAGRAVVYGSFRARLQPRWIAAHGAVVPVTLVLVGSEEAAPIVRTLRLPSFDPADPAHPPATVTGTFAVDLMQLAPLATRQTYFVHAFTSDASSAAVSIGIATQG
jgi:hypothetical protein